MIRDAERWINAERLLRRLGGWVATTSVACRAVTTAGAEAIGAEQQEQHHQHGYD
jgi:hypothetical protein